ncbi:T9SS type A sorting domain-containing protein [bacterium]|nr:T9SS type A sorting domain-containing protein [bacterium]
MKKFTLFVLSLGLGLGTFAQTVNGIKGNTVDINIDDFYTKSSVTDVKAALSADVTEVTDNSVKIQINCEDMFAVMYLIASKATLSKYYIDSESAWVAAFKKAQEQYESSGHQNIFAGESQEVEIPSLKPGTEFGAWFFGLDDQNISSMDQVYPYFVTFKTTGESVGLTDADMTSVAVYPNPASDVVRVNAQDNINNVEIINTLGQVVYSSAVNNNSAQINVAGLQKGTYTIKINSEGKIITSKIIMK